MPNFLEIIQRRKIDRVAAAYGVAAWLVVQAAAIALPAFDAPGWVLKALIAAAIIGFPVTLWIAWHVTPVPHTGRYPAPPPSRATDFTLLAFLAAVILLSVVGIASQMGLLPGFSKPASPDASSRQSADTSPPKSSIAVLPFINLSGDPSKDYVSDGISEELLNQLASTPALRVAAQTSSFAFKGKNEDIRNIARELNVGAMLEGSVWEDGRQIRITAQLINASDGFQMWSETFDRDLSNILQVQDEIARAIIVALTHGLLGNTGTESTLNQGSIDPQAYRNYLQAQAFSALKTGDDDEKAIALYKQVTQAEPKFAPAYAALGRTYIHEAEFQNRRADLVAAAETALEHALALDPRNLDALSSHLSVALMKWEWDKAAADARRLKSLNPHSVFTLRGLNSYYRSLGFPDQQSAALREASRLDPLSFVDLNNLATVYNDRGEYAEAESAASDALTLRPDRALTLYTLCMAYVGLKRANRAQILIDQLSSLKATDASQACALQNAAATGRKAEAHMLADSMAARFPTFVFGEADIGSFYLIAGDVPRALGWFGRAYDARDDSVFAIPYLATTPPSFAKSPGWTALVRKPEAKAWQAAHDRLAEELSAN